jgi:hypothetical protein
VGAQPEHNARSLHQGEHNDFFRNTFEAPHDIATQHTTSYEAVVPRPTQRSREVTSSSSEGETSDMATHSGREGVKGGKKRHKQCLQGVVGGSGMRLTSTVARNDKHQVRPPMDHFKRLLEEACPNHAYPVRHKLKDCNMMRSFMTSGPLTWGAELDEGSDRSNTMPFPRENAVLTVYRGCPH